MLLNFLNHLVYYKSNKTASFIIVTGFLALFILVIQVISGVMLSLGVLNDLFLVNHVHSVFSSLLIFIIYIHLYKSFYIRSGLGDFYNIAFISGWVALLWFLITCFTGYVIPWGQISYWGAKVVVGTLDIIPLYGDLIKRVLCGGFELASVVIIPRFKSLHLILGLLTFIVVFIHIVSVHRQRSVNSSSFVLNYIHNCTYLYPTFYVKDFFAFILLFFILTVYFTYGSNYFEEHLNNLVANVLETPTHIVPEWYFLTNYGVLKYASDKYIGIVLAVLTFFIVFIPSFNNSKGL